MSWFGRQMRTYSKGTTSASFKYDADGLRSEKVVNGVKTTYQYVGDKLYYENIGDNKILYYFYDSYGNLSQIYYTVGSTYARYYVATNAQGDVFAIYNDNGVKVGAYDYDAWGNTRVFVVTQDANGNNVHTQIDPETQYLNHIINVNPIRYRGYYYDSDLDLYYLQSRYYDAEIGRFLNSDSVTDSNAGVLGYNTYLYCGNNPVNSSDPSGHWIIKDAIKRFAKKVCKKVSVWKEKAANNTGTLQIGKTVSGSFLLQGTCAGSVAFDKRGNVGYCFTYGKGTGSQSVSVSGLFTVTEAPAIYNLIGESFQVGGSLDVEGVSVGLEYTGMMDSYGELYSGITTTVGAGLAFPAPGEIHMDITETKVYGLNIFDSIKKICTKIMEW